jgi:hypothetical protein
MQKTRTNPSMRKVTGGERKKERKRNKNVIKNGHFFPLERPRAVHTLLSNQKCTSERG